MLEGADGAGKTTQASRLAAALRARGRDVLHVRDPGTTRLAEAIRAILLDPEQGHVAAAAETCLYFAARAQLIEEVVAPAKARGTVVLSERWTLSTEVYQGVAAGFGAARVRRAALALLPNVRPDLTLVLDVAPGAGLARLGRERDRMEQKGDAFHRRVVLAYRRLAARRPATTRIPQGTPDEVHAAILRAVGRLGV